MTETSVTDPQLAALVAAGFDPDKYEFSMGPGERIYAPHQLPDCPPWCRHTEQFADHGYESCNVADAATFSRFHTSSQASTAYVTQEEFNRGGAISYGPLVISAWIGGGDCVDMSSDDVRAAVASLSAAADLRDRIAAGGAA